MGHSFKAFRVQRTAGGFARSVEFQDTDDLPEGDVLVRVEWSALNYKDALSATGHPGVSRNFPHTPGIDAAGIVVESRIAGFSPGDRVIVSGHDLGMGSPGGFAQYVRAPAQWIEPCPRELDLREAMILGTAGVTAAQALWKFERNGLRPDAGPVLVTGASGGVGSIAVSLLGAAGFEVEALSGKADAAEWLRSLGAARVLGRETLADVESRPLLHGRWAAIVDTVGGVPLAVALKSISYGGMAAICGLAGSPQLPTTVYPFILRGVTAFGIDSAQCPAQVRREMWARLAGPWRPARIESLALGECTLEELEPQIHRILAGGQRGRLLVRPT